MEAKELTPEVLVAATTVPTVTREGVGLLKGRALASPRHRARLLLHASGDDPLHEMLIVLTKDCYLQPHRNDRSSKTYHVVEGSVECVLFGDDGTVAARYRMTDAGGGGVFLLRISHRCFHTLIPLSDTVAFVETILGPFLGTTYAEWAPPEGDAEGSRRYSQKLSSTPLGHRPS